jgi:hypothetical protein
LSAPISIEAIDGAFAPHGLLYRGGFHPASRTLDFDGAVGTIVLIGNAGSAMWSPFLADPIAHDGEPDPLNRWIERIVDSAARTLDARPVYAHQGPPFLPFLTWAAQCDAVSPSPLGLFVHPDFGLWHAYRAALLFEATLALPALDRRPSPCETCADRPCTTACRVPGNDLIRDHVQGCAGSGLPEGRDCRENGCGSRRACPFGQDHMYEPAHMRFHMEAFLRSGAL